MRLLLTSSGLRFDPPARAFESLIAKPLDEVSFAVVAEAHVVEREHGWLVDELSALRARYPGPFELIDLLALEPDEVERRLLEHDVLLVTGGEPSYLVDLWQRRGFAPVLERALARLVYVGSSAGSMVAGRLLADEARELLYAGEPDYGVRGYLELIDLALVPHLHSQITPAALAAAAALERGPVYGIAEDDAIVAVDGDLRALAGPLPQPSR